MISNPNKPNPDQLQYIHPKNSPSNPARYEAAPAEGEEELKTEGPTIVLHPNAVYLVDPEAAGARRDALEEVVGGETQAPVLTSLDPDELPVWAQDTEVFFRGSNFTEDSVIVWNGGEEPTTFIDEATLSTIVKPSTVQASPPFTVEAYVLDDGKETTHLAFTFIS